MIALKWSGEFSASVFVVHSEKLQAPHTHHQAVIFLPEDPEKRRGARNKTHFLTLLFCFFVHRANMARKQIGTNSRSTWRSWRVCLRSLLLRSISRRAFGVLRFNCLIRNTTARKSIWRAITNCSFVNCHLMFHFSPSLVVSFESLRRQRKFT